MTGKLTFQDAHQKARQISWVNTVINDIIRWSKSLIKIILIHIFRDLNLLKTRPFSSHVLNHKAKATGHNITVSIDVSQSRDRL